LSSEALENLYRAIREVLLEWTERLRADNEDEFPKKDWPRTIEELERRGA